MGRSKRGRARGHVAAAKPKNDEVAQASTNEDVEMGEAAMNAVFPDEEPQEDVVEDGDAEVEGESLSRGQRKRLKRRAAFMRKMGLVNHLEKAKSKDSKKKKEGAFADLEEIQKSLFVDQDASAKKEKTTDQPKRNKPLSGKQRQKLAVKELGQLRAVQTHPSFQGDPFAAIQMHLQHTVVPSEEKTSTANN